MKFSNMSLIVLGSASLLLLGACSSNSKAAKTESTTTSTPAAKTETTTATKDREKHSEGDDLAFTKDDRKDSQVVQSRKYHLKFKTALAKDSTHLDIKLHDRQGKEITDAKLTAQVQLPGGSNQVLSVPYSVEEKYYVAKLLTKATGDYQVALQADVKSDKFNTKFSFKR